MRKSVGGLLRGRKAFSLKQKVDSDQILVLNDIHVYYFFLFWDS